MKKLLLIGIAVAVLGIGIVYATDNTKHIRKYSDQGRTAGYIVNQGLTAVFDADGDQGITTTNRYQLQRRTLTVPVTLTSAAADTVTNPLLVVPAGQTITITEAILTASAEVINAAGDSSFGAIMFYHDDKTLDTCVAQFNDEASTIAYDDTIFTMTLIDSVFTAGEILYFWQMNHRLAATAAEGVAITLEYLLDE